MQSLLKAAAFDLVETKRDLGLAAMRRALRDFSDRVRDADIAAVFFAGHGIEVNGTNYLIRVDATLERDTDVEDETISLERVTQMLEVTKRLRLVMLDACRDNPFVRSMKRTVSSRSSGRGLAEVRVLTSDTLIALAAKAGSTAADGEGANSPYTTALRRINFGYPLAPSRATVPSCSRPSFSCSARQSHSPCTSRPLDSSAGARSRRSRPARLQGRRRLGLGTSARGGPNFPLPFPHAVGYAGSGAAEVEQYQYSGGPHHCL